MIDAFQHYQPDVRRAPHPYLVFTFSEQFDRLNMMPAPVRQYAINYFPVSNGGYQMWSSYDGRRYQSDMQIAQSLGFNTIRVILAARDGSFTFSTPSAAELAHLTDLYSRSKSVGVTLHLTLFDYWSSYGLVEGSRAWTRAVLGALPDVENIAVIEIQNEARYASIRSYRSGFDSGWPPGMPQFNKVGRVAVVWVKEMTQYIRSSTPGVPVTASCSHGMADLLAYTAAVRNTLSAPDWFDWHCYARSPGLVHSALQNVIEMVGDPGMLYIGETGLPSSPSGAQGAVQAEQSQSDYLQAVRWACGRLGLPEPSPWILFDLNDSAQFPGGQTFGLFDTIGNAKLSGRMYQAIPPGSVIPTVGLNGDMRGNQLDSHGNVLPIRWALYRGQTGTQPVASVIDTTNNYRGNPTVMLTGSGRTSTGDNPPALESRPCTWPTIAGGRRYTFSCVLMAAAAYGSSGSPSLQISWYDSANRYISSDNGAAVALTSSFARHSISGIAPAGSAYVRLFVRVGYNEGRIWVGDATWTGGTGN